MNIIVTSFPSVEGFLGRYQPSLEKREAAHQILLDLCFYVKNFPKTFLPDPYFKAFEDERKLLLVAAMARPHRLVLSGDEGVENSPHLSEWLESVARDFLVQQWMPSGVIGAPKIAETFAGCWKNLSGSTFQKVRQFRIHQAFKVETFSAAQGRCRLATMEDIELIIQWLENAQKEECPEAGIPAVRETVESKIKSHDIYFWEDSRPVSLVSFARTALNSARLSLVYTPPEFRKKGYAAAMIAEVTQILLDGGNKPCVVISDASNSTARQLYERLGYTFVCDLHEYTFQNPKNL